MNKYYTLVAAIVVMSFSFNYSFGQLTPEFQQSLISYNEVSVDVSALKSILRDAPMRGTLQQNRNSNTLVSLPMPSGATQQFRVFEAPMMSPELSAEYPEFKSYAGQGIEDPTAVVRFNLTPEGFYGIISGIEGASIIERVKNSRSTNDYVTYFDHHIISDQEGFCETELDNHAHGSEDLAAQPRSNSCFQNGGTLRTYEIVLTCTGEFYQLNGNSNSGAMTGLMNRMTPITAFYEKELAISFSIVEYLLNSNPVTDPFTDPTNTTVSIDQSEDHINNNVTVGSWDLGHGFHEINTNDGWAGRAGVGVVCTSSKASGYTYLRNDNVTSIVVQLHEFGHMFSCNHTNYGCGTGGDCDRYEPGRGTSIMSTSAGCSPEDFYDSRTNYFGAGSLQSIMNFITTGTRFNSSCNPTIPGSWSQCEDQTSTGNNPPSSDANANNINGLTIPHSTPFELDGAGSDADGNGSLTYNWEQYDTDTGSALPDDTGGSTTAPIFRSVPPSVSTSRTCPQLSSVLAGNVTTGTGEVLPTGARTLTWRLTVRDNVAGGGGIACDEISLNVGSDGPFQITSQNGTTAWNAGNTETITWNVANTDNATYTCPNVDILYSSDGGATFAVALATGVTNDGSHDITVPNSATNTGRIKIVCTGNSNIFFDINDTDIAILSGCSAAGGTIANSANVIASPGDASLDLNLCAGVPVSSWTEEVTGSDGTMALTFEEGGACGNFVSNDPRYDNFRFCIDQDRSVTFQLAGFNFTNVLNLYQGDFDDNSTCTNWIASNTTDSNLGGGVDASLSSSITENLVAGQVYELVSSDFSGTPANGNFTINFNPTTAIYDVSATSPAGFLYTYVIVSSNGSIFAFDPDADLSDANVYTGGDFTVHGLSYQVGENLNAEVGTTFASFQNDLFTGAICGNLSANSVSVEILGATTPVELLSFNGRLENKSVLLEWQTQTEINNDYFLIEKSADGRNFQRLGTVQGAGDAEVILSYELVDPNPIVGMNYYRLTQFDFDGTSTVVDKIVAVEYEGTGIISVQPNPVKGSQIQLIYPSQSRGDLAVEVYSMTGQLVRTLNFNVESERNVFEITLDDLSAGVYLLRTQQQERMESLRFVKTE